MRKIETGKCTTSGEWGLLRATIAVTLAGSMCGAMAQETPQRSSGLEEIIVTAQKREENLQSVPISITAFDSRNIENLALTNISDLHGAVPNLWIVQQATSPGNPSATIRGVNSNVSLTIQEGGVAFYVDGVYIANNMGASLDVADIERVEVLRGPQGTLYGRNSTGGAVNFISRAPTGEFGFRQDFSVGNYNLFKSRTNVDLPEWRGLSATLSFLKQDSDGFVDNLSPGRSVDYSLLTEGARGVVRSSSEFGGTDIEAAQVALRWESGDFRADYKVNYTDSANIPRGIQVLGFVDGAGGGAAQFIYSVQPPGTPIFVGGERLDAVSNPYVSPELLEVWNHALTLSWAASDTVTLRNITGYRDVDNFSTSDLGGGGGLIDPFGGTGAPFTLFTGVYDRDLRQFTNEFQVIGSGDRVDWVTGLYYLDVYYPDGGPHTSINWAFRTMPADLNGGVFPVAADPLGYVENKAYAAFGQGTLHATDEWDLTLGLRQSWDERSAHDGGTGSSYDERFDHFDWTVIASYKPTEDLNLYGKVSTGYLSGGVAGFSQTEYEPEEVLQVELGVKADALDHRLRTNAALFWSDYDDIQVLDFSTGEVLFVNAAKATVYGAELELTAMPIDGLTLTANYGYTNFEYDEFILQGVDVTNTQRAWFRPEHTANLGAEYAFAPFSWGGELSMRLDASYQSKIYFTPILSNAEYDDNATAEPRWELNARATLAEIGIGKSTGQIALWCRNLTDEDELEFAAAVGSTVIGTFMRPRTYGVDLSVKF